MSAVDVPHQMLRKRKMLQILLARPHAMLQGGSLTPDVWQRRRPRKRRTGPERKSSFGLPLPPRPPPTKSDVKQRRRRSARQWRKQPGGYGRQRRRDNVPTPRPPHPGWLHRRLRRSVRRRLARQRKLVGGQHRQGKEVEGEGRKCHAQPHPRSSCHHLQFLWPDVTLPKVRQAHTLPQVLPPV
jgi:hypothetical protein